MKKNIKWLTLLFILIIMTGCSGEYYLTINDNQMSEKITMNIYESDHKKRQYEADKIDIASDFIKKDYYAFFENYDELYNKKILKKNNYTSVILDYDFTMDNYDKSYYINSCFQTKKINQNKDTYIIELSGNFYCLYGKELNIKVKSYNKVISSNADNVNGNVYTWNINSGNVKDVSIMMKIKIERLFNNFIRYILIISVSIIILIVVLIFLRKQKANNKF